MQRIRGRAIAVSLFSLVYACGGSSGGASQDDAAVEPFPDAFPDAYPDGIPDGIPDIAFDGPAIPGNSKLWCDVPLPSCSGANVCGVCVKTPTSELIRTHDTKESSGAGDPDVACLDGAGLVPLDPASSRKVTMRGWVKLLLDGPDTRNVKIEVFKEVVDAAGRPTGRVGDLVGSALSIDTLPDGTGARTETITVGGTSVTRVLLPYIITGSVPTETPLVIKTSSKSTIDVDGWFPVYELNQVVRNAEVKGDAWSKDVRAIGEDEYATVLKAAYARPPEGGMSAIVAEIHDCGDVRVSNATVESTFGGPYPGLPGFYLSDVEDDPLPVLGRRATGRLGLWMKGGVSPATVTVAAAGLLGGKVLALGSYPLQTFPDAVTFVTLRGPRAWQLAKPD